MYATMLLLGKFLFKDDCVRLEMVRSGYKLGDEAVPDWSNPLCRFRLLGLNECDVKPL